MGRARYIACALLMLCPLALTRHDDDFAFDNSEEFLVSTLLYPTKYHFLIHQQDFHLLYQNIKHTIRHACDYLYLENTNIY